MSGSGGDPASPRRRMRIAIAGTRGVPARYGGFETFAEELGSRLAARGHAVTVYCRAAYAMPGLAEHRGMRLVVLPTLRRKYFDTVAHTLVSSVHALGQGYDAVVLCNAANAVTIPLFRAGGAAVALNVDGIERQRRKWGRAGRAFYALSERIAVRLASALVADARVIAEYYARQHDAATVTIAYGVDARPLPPGETLARLDLTPRRYVLYVSRLEPENNPLAVAREYATVPGDLPLVLVGDAPYAEGLKAELRALSDPRLRLPGGIYGDGYRELLSHAGCYVQATEVGGTHPALVEAMGYGNCVLYHRSPENVEVAADAGIPFDVHEPGSLAAALTRVLDDPQTADVFRARASARAGLLYRWEDVASRYESLLEDLANALA